MMKKTITKTSKILGEPIITLSVTRTGMSQTARSDKSFTLTLGDTASILVDSNKLLYQEEKPLTATLYFESVDTYGPAQIHGFVMCPESTLNEEFSYESGQSFEFEIPLGKGTVQVVFECEEIADSDDDILPAYIRWTFAAPYIELKHETVNTFTETKSFSLAKETSASLDLRSGEISFAVRDINDPVLGFSVSHHYAKPTFYPWRTSLDETLKEETVSIDGEGQKVYIFTDISGENHVFEERFYTLKETGEKSLVETATANAVTADADGRLWYRDREVFRDLRTPSGLRATTRLSNVNDAEWIEQRYGEEKQATEQLQALEDQLCSFVLVNEETGEEISKINSLTLSISNNFEYFLSCSGILLTASEAINYRALVEERDNLETDELKAEFTEKNISSYLTTAEKYRTALPLRYTEYVTAKADLETLKESIPVSFLYSDNGAKGFNLSGALVTIQPKGGKPLVISRERYKDNRGRVYRHITSVHDEDGHAMKFYYDSQYRLCRVMNSVGEEVTFTYEGSNLHEIKRSHLPDLTLAYTDDLITSVSDEHNTSALSYDILNRLRTFRRETDVKRVVHGTVETIGEEETPVVLADLALAYTNGTVTVSNLLKNTQAIYTRVNGLVEEIYTIEHGKVAGWEKSVLDTDTELPLVKYTISPYCVGRHSYEEFWQEYSSEENVYEMMETYTYNDFYECTGVVSKYLSPEGFQTATTTTTTNYNEKGKPLHITAEEVYSNSEKEFSKTTVTHERFFYDSADQLVKTESYTEGKEHLLGIDVEEIFYDENGRETQRIVYNSLAPSDKSYTERAYDEESRVAFELDETGRHKTAFEYRGLTGDVCRVKSPNGSALAYAYDKEGREASVTMSDENGEGNTNSVYYTEGLPVCATNGKHVFNYTYDGKGRNTKIDIDGWDYLGKTYTEGADTDGTATETVTTTYAGFESAPVSVTTDKLGKVKSRTVSGIKNISYTYKPDGRVESETDAVSNRVKSYTYDEDHRLTGYTDTLGVTESMEYDYESRVSKITETAGGNTVESTYAYDDDTEHLKEMHTATFHAIPSFDPVGREAKRTVWRGDDFVHGVKTSYIKHGDHATVRPSSLEFSSPNDYCHLNYVYDTMGNIEKVLENGLLSVRYEYDALGRLIREDNRAFEKTSLWTYDRNGNILSRREYAFTVRPTEELAELTPTNTLTYGYKGDYLVSLNGEHVIHYGMEGHPDSYRGSEIVWETPNRATVMCGSLVNYNSDDLLNNTSFTSITYGRDGRVLCDDNFRYLYDEKGELLGFIDLLDAGKAEYLYRRDAQGNIIAILDNTGTVVVKYVYDAWGNHKVLNPDGTENTNSGFLGNCNPYRYRGYYYCAGLGLYYLKTRFYDPTIGRFISADSLDYLDPHTVGGMNLFAYCNNNPVMNVDPTGHAWRDWLGIFAVAAVAVVTVAACVVSLGSAVPAVVALGAGVASAGLSAAEQYAETGEVNVKEVVYDGLVGTVNGALATTGISGAGSVVAGALLGGASSVGNDLLFNDGKVDANAALQSAVLGGLGGLISGPGAKNDILKFNHSQTILNNTIKNGTKRAIAHQALVRNKHARALLISAVRFTLSGLVPSLVP